MLKEAARSRISPDFAKTTFLVYVLIASIAVFFLATFVAYAARFIVSGQSSFELRKFPLLLWWSTALLLSGSHFLFRAYALVRREKQKQFRIALTLSFLLGGAFCVVQGIGIAQLLNEHWSQADNRTGSVASVMIMVFLHVAHFAAGYLALGYVTVNAYRGRYDHEYANGVRLAGIYWRFLDIIWLCMLLLFWFAANH